MWKRFWNVRLFQLYKADNDWMKKCEFEIRLIWSLSKIFKTAFIEKMHFICTSQFLSTQVVTCFIALLYRELVSAILYHKTRHDIQKTNPDLNNSVLVIAFGESSASCVFICANKQTDRPWQILTKYDTNTGACDCFQLLHRLQPFDQTDKLKDVLYTFHGKWRNLGLAILFILERIDIPGWGPRR